MTAPRLAKSPVLRRDSKTETTRRVEADFDLGDCLYFYVGHACPDFGDTVFVYEPDLGNGMDGSATPFDTGGVHAGHVLANGIDTTDKSKKEYLLAHQVELAAWQTQFDAYVQKHFESRRAYIRGDKPKVDDATHRLHHPKNKRRAWTWEVRVHGDHPVHARLRLLCMTADFAEALRLALLELTADEREEWDDVLDNRSLSIGAAGEAAELCNAAEEKMASWH